MQVRIDHIEKKQGLIFGKTLHGVRCTVQFNEEEKAIITERKLQRLVILEREMPADKNEYKEENRGMLGKMAKVASGGFDALNYHLTVGKLLSGPDEYFMSSPIECKGYEVELKEKLAEAKQYIVLNKEVGGSDSFEL